MFPSEKEKKERKKRKKRERKKVSRRDVLKGLPLY